MTTNPKDTAPGWRLTGRHVLAMTVAFFAVIAAVDGTMIYYAVSTFSGTVTDSSFVSSQTYNREIALAARQDKLGWKLAETLTRAPDGEARIEIEARDADGRPLAGLVLRAELRHPVQRKRDHGLDLVPVVGSEGRYAGVTQGVAAGQWDLVLIAEKGGERVYESRNRLILR